MGEERREEVMGEKEEESPIEKEEDKKQKKKQDDFPKKLWDRKLFFCVKNNINPIKTQLYLLFCLYLES